MLRTGLRECSILGPFHESTG